jgi:hypothetical protein
MTTRKRTAPKDDGVEQQSTKFQKTSAIKIMSWSMASLTATLKKGMWQFVNEANADIVLLQEIKG